MSVLHRLSSIVLVDSCFVGCLYIQEIMQILLLENSPIPGRFRIVAPPSAPPGAVREVQNIVSRIVAQIVPDRSTIRDQLYSVVIIIPISLEDYNFLYIFL